MQFPKRQTHCLCVNDEKHALRTSHVRRRRQIKKTIVKIVSLKIDISFDFTLFDTIVFSYVVYHLYLLLKTTFIIFYDRVTQ